MGRLGQTRPPDEHCGSATGVTVVESNGERRLRHTLLISALVVCALAVAMAARAMPAEEELPPPEQHGEMVPLPAVAAADAAVAARARKLLPRGSRYAIPQIRRFRSETWRWQQLMGRPRTPATASARRSRVAAYRRWVLRLWKARAARARRHAHNPPRKHAWLCIQRHEGAWRDSGGPYYGGLQMDLSFQRAYGRELLARKGTANRWSPVEQMWVAERAYRAGRGFQPWPNTARYCGLM